MQAETEDDDIVVQIANNFKDLEFDPAGLRKLVKAICNRFALSRAAVSIAIVDDAQIRGLNNQFLECSVTTDCLSFDLSDDAESARSFELVVNGEMALRQAALRGHSGQAELALYVTHGMLHNLGFDDADKTDAKKMHDAEDEILQQQGYGPVYNSDVKHPTDEQRIDN